MIGALAAVALLRRSRIASGFGSGLVLCGVPLVLIAVLPKTVPAVVLLVFLGVGVTIVDFSAVTLLQRAIPEDEMAKAFSVLQSLFVGSLGLGAAFAPLLVHWLGIRGALIASGAVLPDTRRAPLEPPRAARPLGVLADELVNLLRAIPIFQPLELPTLERLARTAIPAEAGAGETVVAEGETGDRYYVIRSGELDVTAKGQPLRTLTAGEGFGEIALLRDVPRTATVTARTAVQLYALEREHFLDAVNGSPGSREAADSMIDVRLGSLRSELATF